MTKYSKNELIDLLKNNSSVEVKFTKKTTGENRVMICTLNEDVLRKDGVVLKTNTTRKVADNLVQVYDVESSGFRSFDINTVYAVSV